MDRVGPSGHDRQKAVSWARTSGIFGRYLPTSAWLRFSCAMAFATVIVGLFGAPKTGAASEKSASARTPVLRAAMKVQAPTAYSAFEDVSRAVGGPFVVVREPFLREASADHRKTVFHGFPLGDGRSISLEVEPMRVVGPRTRVVVGGPNGVDLPLPYDTSQVHLFRGTVQGRADSSVVLMSSPRGIRGHIDLGAKSERFVLSTVEASAAEAGMRLAVVHPAMRGSQALPDVDLCGTPAPTVAGCCSEPAVNVVFNKRLKAVELAIETDFELYNVFQDAAVVTDYLIELVARTNAIFMLEMDTRFEVVFIRLFDNPANEPSFMSNADPLNGYVNFWNSNMGAVARDTGIFLSGRRDLPYGGIAYIGAVCSANAYGVCGYMKGFPDPNLPATGDYDLGVLVHELGHNFGACHTPDYCPFIDRCYPPPVFPQRGSLMSYCSQTVSGGDLVTDLWYHTRLRRVMRNFVENSAFCLSNDCNQNGLDDAGDISGGFSVDTNGNGVPDECEDCNQNGVLDPADISMGTSTDLNGNGVPDDCEPDCNNNSVPDDRDILLGTSVDLWGNGIPDECDPDCDANGTPDYDQIQAVLALDIDRDAVLDSCQDCDGNGISDLTELMGSRNAWVASDVLDYIGQYHAISGVLAKTSTTGQIASAQDLIVAPGDRVLVTSAPGNKVVVYNALTGAHLGDFVTAGSGGLTYPTGLIMAPDGHLLVSSRNSNSVLRYDGTTGAFVNAFVPTGSGGLLTPFGLTFGPNGNLFVTSGGNQVLEYNGTTGAFVRVFVSTGNNGGLGGARGLVFLPDGHLLVASYNTDALLRYDGATGAFLGKWNFGGTASALYLDGPWGVRVAPNGNVFVTRDLPANHDHDEGPIEGPEETAPLHVTAARIMEFDVQTGLYVRSFIVGDDTGLRSTTGFDFMPGTMDCDFNMRPDNCDISLCSGDPACGDCNANQRPDSCDIASCAGDPACGDCNANGVPDGCDLFNCSGSAACLDCNANAIPDACDVSACSGDPACMDCNLNEAPDSCDIAGGFSTDDNANGVPDECETVFDPPTPVADPSGINKTRFISFNIPQTTSAGGAETALRVTLVSLHHVLPPYSGEPSVPFTQFEGQSQYVGPPLPYVESTASAIPFFASTLQCTPHYQDWTTVGLLHVTGNALVPSSTYEVANLAASCMGNEGSCTSVSAPLTIGTTRWGDVSTPFNPPPGSTQPDFGDISSLVDKFKGVTGAPIKARALLVGINLRGDVDIAPDLNFTHIAAGVDAFKGLPYPHKPGKCAGNPSMACSADGDCPVQNQPCVLCP